MSTALRELPRSPARITTGLGVLRRSPAWTFALVLSGIYLAADPRSADLAAQTYRTWLFSHAPWGIWDGRWYGGHHLPAYSVVFPPLSWLLGPRVVGALSAVLAAWAAERLLRTIGGPGARLAGLWFAAGTVGTLVSGRLTFALGVAAGSLALLAFVRGRRAASFALAALTPLCSPVAGAFLALIAIAWLVAAPDGVDARRRWWPATGIAAAAVVPTLVVSYVFPEGGDFPFAPLAFWPSLAATALLAASLPREARLARAAVGLYAVLLVASFALHTPMGGNAVRLGAILAGPLAAYALWPTRRLLLVLIAPAMLYWQWQTPVDDWWQARTDWSVHTTNYDGVVRFLATQPATRVEVPFTDQHWEATVLARHVPLARGWERQLDREVNPLFYERRPLTAQRYRRWLDDNAVGFVALPEAPIDYSGAREAALVRTGLPYLRQVYRDVHWTVFAVQQARPLADGARVLRFGIDDLVLDAPRAGRVVVRVRWTSFWRIVEGAGCVRPAGEWTAVELTRPGRVRLSASFALGRVRATSPRCTDPRV